MVLVSSTLLEDPSQIYDLCGITPNILFVISLLPAPLSSLLLGFHSEVGAGCHCSRSCLPPLLGQDQALVIKLRYRCFGNYVIFTGLLVAEDLLPGVLVPVGKTCGVQIWCFEPREELYDVTNSRLS